MSSDEVWERIEKAADGLVEKSASPLTREQAVDRVLKSAEGRALYAEYLAGYYRERLG